MNNHNTLHEKSETWPSWLVLFIRWLLGGISGVWISSWFYFGIATHATTGSYLWLKEILSPFKAAPFAGLIYLFNLDKRSFLNISDFFITYPALIWGLIGALLASGRSDQVKTGAVLLGLIVIVGFISFFRMVMMVPT